MRRPKFKEYNGKQILHIDLSNMQIDQKQEAKDRIDAARAAISKHPPASLLILTTVHNAHYDKEIARYIKEYVAHNKPFVKRSAVLGLKGLQIPLYNAVNRMAGRNMRSFSSEEQALVWLTEESKK